MTAVWTQWEGRVVNGIYPLRRFLNASDHSAVFLTESTAEGFLNAAVKLVPADPALIAVQLWHWKTAATFSHPHLIRLLDCGQCEIEARAFLFVVMEYAEENLSQILPVRALAPDEVRELLVPTLDALAFLHRENWVQGQLKPSNFLVVNDQLKLATDTIRPASVAREPTPRPSLYDPPEAHRGEVSTAVDVWALGVTLVEALTQYPPTWLYGPSEPASLPTNLPSVFVDVVKRCLSVDPANRPDVWKLQELTRPASNGPRTNTPPQPQVRAPAPVREPAAQQQTAREPAAPIPEPAVETVIRATPPPDYPLPPEEPQRSLVKPGIAAIAVVLVAVWGGNHYLHRKAVSAPGASARQAVAPPPTAAPPLTASLPPTAAPPRTGAPPPPARAASNQVPMRPAAEPRNQRASSADSSASTVVHEEIPNVPQSARSTIHGRVMVAVRVTVDSSGRVVRDTFENPGPSKYFSRLASQAARKWKFAAADQQRSREWLLRFEFGRDGTTVHATHSGS